MEPDERLERLDRALADLAEASRDSWVLVEGVRDAAALRALGVDGNVVVYNRAGRSMVQLADELRGRGPIIVLFDWDRKGGHLTRLLRDQLSGSRLDFDLRKELATVSLVKCVEDLPAARENLRQRVERARES